VEAGQSVLVVSPANAERTALNTAIRQTLQDRGRLSGEGIAHRVLINRNITGAERTWARSYSVGDVLRYRHGSKKLGIAAGAYVRVETVNTERNHVTMRTEEGTTHTYSPTKLKGVEVFREEVREFVTGERIQFRAPLKAQQIPNGALGRIEKWDRDSGQVTITLDAGPSFATTLKDLRHIEYGYATTSHSSQGATIDRVLVNIDTEHSVALVNQQQFYVSISRARQDARIFTNQQDELSHAVSRSWPKATALDAVAKSEDDLKYATQRNNGRNSGATYQHDGHQQLEAFGARQRAPVASPDRLAPTPPGNQRQQIDAALLVSHRQTDWRREQRRTRPEQTVAHSLMEQREARALLPPRHEDRAERKPGLHKGMGYRR
jgi:hypothetical protein